MSLPKSMRAMVLEEPDGPLELREVPLPVPGENEVLLRVRACAVDRFDIAIRKGGIERATLPHVLGHEIAGEVAALGSGVEGWAPGDRVATTLYLICGECRRCKGDRETICENFGGHIGVNTWGGYAEYTLMPAHNLVKLPNNIGFPEASVLANAVGTPYHALVSRMGIGEGDFLIVTGAGGGVGLHAVQIGVMRGARVMGVDIGAHKHDAILAQGAEHAVEASALPELAMEWTDGRGVDGVLELVGTATMPHTFASLAKGGQMVIVGSHTGSAWEIDTGLIYRKELEIRGSRNVSAAELRTVVDLVADGKLTPIIAGTFPLDEAEALQARVADGSAVGREVLVP